VGARENDGELQFVASDESVEVSFRNASRKCGVTRSAAQRSHLPGGVAGIVEDFVDRDEMRALDEIDEGASQRKTTW
jgi:hypothetical protein